MERACARQRPSPIHRSPGRINLTTSWGDIRGEEDRPGCWESPVPVLTRSNYAEWEVVVKVMLKARGLWKAVDVGTEDEEDDQLAMEAILKAVPSEYRVALGSKDTAKDACDALKTMRLGNECARKAKAQ